MDLLRWIIWVKKILLFSSLANTRQLLLSFWWEVTQSNFAPPPPSSHIYITFIAYIPSTPSLFPPPAPSPSHFPPILLSTPSSLFLNLVLNYTSQVDVVFPTHPPFSSSSFTSASWIYPCDRTWHEFWLKISSNIVWWHSVMKGWEANAWRNRIQIGISLAG